MKTQDIRTWVPNEKDAKEVQDTPMLNTTARESVDMNESNDVGKELVNNETIKGPFGITGRH